MEVDDSFVEVTRYVQKTDTSCGAACCVMLLDYFGGSATEQQAAELIDANEVEPDEWYADPAGMAHCLNADWKPEEMPFESAAVVMATLEDTLSRIVHALVDEKIPCVALVYGGAHWVVINGVKTRLSNGVREVTGVSVVDPYEFEPEKRFVPVAVLGRKYFQPVDFGNRWLGKLVLVTKDSPTAPPALLNLKAAFSRALMQGAAPEPMVYRRKEFLELVSRSFSLDDRGVGTPEVRHVTRAISLLALSGFENIDRLKAGGAALPTEISVSSSNGSYSILWVDASNESYFSGTACVAIEPNTNTLLEAAPDDRILRGFLLHSDEYIEAHFSGLAYKADDIYYWEPTQVSRSRFSLHRKVERDGVVYFVFPNGEKYTELPVSSKGGA